MDSSQLKSKVVTFLNDSAAKGEAAAAKTAEVVTKNADFSIAVVGGAVAVGCTTLIVTKTVVAPAAVAAANLVGIAGIIAFGAGFTHGVLRVIGNSGASTLRPEGRRVA